MKNNKMKRIVSLFMALLMTIALLFTGCGKKPEEKKPEKTQTVESAKKAAEATIMASGDMLYHMPLINSAKNIEGEYDFRSQFKEIKPLISEADLAIGDFEGSIMPGKPLSGYPKFNAPSEVAYAFKDAGYDVVSVAQNHILDQDLKGAIYTTEILRHAGLDTIGFRVEPSEDEILVKDVNGIKVALIGLSYGYNGMENNLTKADYDDHMMPLTKANAERLIKKAENIADITVVMPHAGVEYQLKPTEKQEELYHEMVDWGADIIFGGHPHVPEPAEIIEKDGENKFIIYSMGNLLSNQRIETLDNKWTERGVVMEANIRKENGKTFITGVLPHPTWVYRRSSENGYDYTVLPCSDYIEGGKKVGTLDANTEERIKTAYKETKELLNIPEEYLKK